jgi:ribokinase
MASSPKIIVVGSANTDMVVKTERIPGPGETVIGGDFIMAAGGKGANQAVAASRLGVQVSMVGRVGDDVFGRRLRSTLETEGVNTQHVTIDRHASTGIAAVIVDSSGGNRIIVIPGANGALTPDHVQAAAPTIARSDVLLLQLEVPLPAVARAIEIAHQSETRVVLNPAPAQALPHSLISQVDYLIPNEVEATTLAGSASTGPRQVARALRQKGASTVVVTLGERGAVLVDRSGATEVAAIALPVVDTTAAGDAFVAAFAVAIAGGETAAEALRWGSAAGALATTKLGAQPSLPTKEALLELLAR